MHQSDKNHNRELKGKWIGIYFTSHFCMCVALFFMGWDFSYPDTGSSGDPFYAMGFLWSTITSVFLFIQLHFRKKRLTCKIQDSISALS